jgi:hypothetical protein
MTDHDRGAYTPQTDAPLAFDARQSRSGGGGGGGSPTTLIVSGLILVLLIGAVVFFYRGGMRAPDGAPPVVGEPVGPMKSAAPADQQPAPAAAQPDVYNSAEIAAPSEPAFAAAPEAPMARPAPRPTLKVETGELPPAEAAGPPPLRPAPPPVKAAPVAAAPKTAPAPKAAAPAPTPAPAASGPAVVQIGAFSSEALAAKGWSDVAAAFPCDMSGKGRRVEAVASNGATLYRGQITGFASREAASAFCAKLKAGGKSCIVR